MRGSTASWTSGKSRREDKTLFWKRWRTGVGSRGQCARPNPAIQRTAGRSVFSPSMTSTWNQQRRAPSPAVADLFLLDVITVHWYWSYGVSSFLRWFPAVPPCAVPGQCVSLRRRFVSSCFSSAWPSCCGVALAGIFFRGADWLAAQTHFLHHVKSLLAGIAMGLFASVVVNRDFYARSRHLSSDI